MIYKNLLFAILATSEANNKRGIKMIRSQTRDENNAPSVWLHPKAFSEKTFETLDEMYFMGDLDGMDAGDVFSQGIKIENEND